MPRRRKTRTPIDNIDNTSRSASAGTLFAAADNDKGNARFRPKYTDGVRNTGMGESPDGANTSYVNTVQEPDHTDISSPAPGTLALNEQEFQARVAQAYSQAELYVDTYIGPARVAAAEYYKGQPFGDEEDGRSQIVLSEVRDTIQSILPSLLRIFTSGEKIVEYLPRRADSIKAAEQATDAVNFVFQDMNAGFSILHSAFKDALLKKLGVVTWWAENEDRVIEKMFSGLAEEDILHFQMQNPGADFLDIVPEPVVAPYAQTYKVRVRLVDQQRKYRVRCLPPESFIIDRRARDTDKFYDLVGYREMVTVSELVQMGFDENDVRAHGAPGQDENWYWTFEEVERNPGFGFPAYPPDPSMARVKYMKLYMRIDKDGDGVAELRCIHAIGSGCYVLKDEVVDHAPFALFCPDPEPHTIYGNSVADVTMDLQKIKSHVMRAMMDSLAQTIFPRTAVVEGQVNMDDVLNKEVGAIIRMRQIGAVQDLSTPFVGQQAMPVLEYLDEIKAQRTGVTPASQGLDADLLQSTTKAAVTAQISAAQERIELIARVFAETGMKQLFTGLLKLICRHQDKPLLVKLRGEWTEVDPTTWDADMDCTVGVALGRGDDAQQMNFLGQIAQKQEMVLQTMGLSNPLVKLSQYQQTLAQLVRKAGFKNADSFFTPITPEMEQQLAQAEQQAKAQQVDPNVLLAKIELAKAQSDTFAKLQQQAINRAQLQLTEDLNRDKLDADVIIKSADLMGKYGQPVDVAGILKMINRPRPDIAVLTEALMKREMATNAEVLATIGIQANQPGPQAAPSAPKPPQTGQGPSPLAQRTNSPLAQTEGRA
jgi:hypothetical protein